AGLFFFFFFQAEDGIRDFHVTGVQTCALPILSSPYRGLAPLRGFGGNAKLNLELCQCRPEYLYCLLSIKSSPSALEPPATGGPERGCLVGTRSGHRELTAGPHVTDTNTRACQQ